MNRHNSACCYCCENSGLGNHCFCYGSVCCAPQWLVNYSNQANGKGQFAPGMQNNNNNNGGNVTIIQPGQPQMGYNQYGQPQYVQGGPTIIRVWGYDFDIF